jgi:UDP-N-acetylmuramyl pentapeptide synthase
LPEKIEPNLQNPQIVAKLLKVLNKGDICLIKGSRSLRLDEVVDRLVLKK